MTELAALNVRITGDAGDLTAAVNSAKTQLGGLNTAISQTQAKAGSMGGALGGLATRMSGARGQIQNVAFQLQDMAVQLQAGTSASVVFAQQGSQIASAFGPVGAVIGALAAVGIPLLAFAFSSASDEADKLSAAAERQISLLEGLTTATYNLRIERNMLQSGVGTAEEQAALNELKRLTSERIGLEAQLAELLGSQSDTIESLNTTEINRLQALLATNGAARDQLQAALDTNSAERERLNRQKDLQSSMVNAYTVYAKTRMEASALADETARAARSFANVQQSLADRGTVYGQVGTRGDPRKMTPAGASPFVYGGPTLDANNNPIAGRGGAGRAGGGGGVNQLESQLEALQESLMSQEQLQIESYARQQETLQQALDARLLSQQDYANLMQQVEATHQAKMGSQMRQGVATTIGALSQLFNKSKPLAIASALVNTWQGMTEALKLPFPKNIAAAATTLATGMNAVRNIRSTSPGGGGSTSGSIGGAGAGAAGGGAAAAPQQTSNISLQLVGGDLFSRDQVLRLINSINEATADGARISLR